MSASASDKLCKGARRWSSTLSSSIADAVVTTMTPGTTDGLPTDTAVEVTIDRVDSSGTKTPAKEEVVRGTVSSSNIINLVRGVEGTAQAHSAGAVVEVRLTADQWGRMVDHGLAQHNQDGTHAAVTATTVATTGAVSTDTISEKTAAAGVTIDGLKIKDSKLETANSVDSDNYVDNSIDGEHLATNAITLGYAQITTNFTTTTVGSMVDVTNLASTVTVPSGGRKVEITAFAPTLSASSAAGNSTDFAVFEGATQLQTSVLTTAGANYNNRAAVVWIGTPTAGSHTYKVCIQQNTAGTLSCIAAATYPAFILVKLI